MVADSGYGSEQNYKWMEDNHIEAFVKYNYFHKEQKRSFKNNAYHASNLPYDAQEDYFICPSAKQIIKIGESERVSDLGYKSKVSYYKTESCAGCPLRDRCYKGDEDRKLSSTIP